MKNTIALPTLTRVFYNYAGNEAAFYMRNGADPKTYCHLPATRTEPVTYTHAQRAADVAAALPGAWAIEAAHADDPASPFYLVRADGLRLFVRFTEGWGSKGKGSASYARLRGPKGERLHLYAPNGGGEVMDPSINFALTKTAEQVAADIARRLLPEAHEVHALAVRALDSARDYASKADTALATAKRHAATLTAYGIDLRPSEGSASVEVRGYLTAEQIEALAARLA